MSPQSDARGAPPTVMAEVGLARVKAEDGATTLALLQAGRYFDLSRATDRRLRSLNSLLELPRAELESLFDAIDVGTLPPVVHIAGFAAPVEDQEVWAAGVTYRRSRDARIAEAVTQDVYSRVYDAPRPELFFKASGWRVVGPGEAVGIRGDSSWDVPEPELAVLMNRFGEVVAYTCGNDMSSRSIEGENPLYLPQAKVYDRSCALGPVAAFAWSVPAPHFRISITVLRNGRVSFEGTTTTPEMVRDPAELAMVLCSTYTLPVGAWLLTGTGIVPPDTFSCRAGDRVAITIDGIGTLANDVMSISHSGATALPRHAADSFPG